MANIKRKKRSFLKQFIESKGKISFINANLVESIVIIKNLDKFGNKTDNNFLQAFFCRKFFYKKRNVQKLKTKKDY